MTSSLHIFVFVPGYYLRQATVMSQRARCLSVLHGCNPRTMKQQRLKVCDLHFSAVIVNLCMLG